MLPAELRSSLNRAVAVVCDNIMRMRQPVRHWSEYSEDELWYELASCILGSRVPYEQSLRAASVLLARGLLANPRAMSSSPEQFEASVVEALSGSPGPGGVCVGGYRFPRLRAKQLRCTLEVLYGRGISLSRILAVSTAPEDARDEIMSMATGAGPKQTSLFLRNIGYTNELAVLDSHVLRYMGWMGLLPCEVKSVGTIRGYKRAEAAFQAYAAYMGFRVADLDLAVWVVARVFRREFVRAWGVVTLVSGGLDSTVMALLAKEEGIEQHPLFIDYGQLCARREWQACLTVHRRFGLPKPAAMNLRGFGKIISSGLTDRRKRIYEDAFLPGRNLLLLVAGASYACQVGANAVAIGLLSDEHHLFPDQTRTFLAGAQALLRQGLGREVLVIAPLMSLSKRDVVELAIQRGISGTYSCHAGTALPCGRCVSCLELQQARR